MKLSAQQFKQLKNKRLTLLGMSGVGKTHLAKLLSDKNEWFHYSGDYRIGSQYLNAAILEGIINKAEQYDWIKDLLHNQSISIKNHITFDNLSSVSTFLGKVGNPEQGGIPIDEFMRRQVLHKQAEINAMLDVEKFIQKSSKQGYNNFINDAGGSLCELDNDDVYRSLAKHTIIIYISANENNKQALIERAQKKPKPLYYQADFFNKQLKIYLAQEKLSYVAQINPDKFVSWIFPKLVAHRAPKYNSIAQKYGYTIHCDDLYKCKSADDVFALIYGALG